VVAVSTNVSAARAFGVAEQNVFPFWDWVGGRYSVWSAIGLAVVLAIGPKAFDAFLAGAHAMDQHFAQAPLERNLPVLLALTGIWNTNFLGHGALSIAPYHQRLARLPAYLQQLEMESTGKRVTVDGQPVDYATCPVLFGEPGTNGQHAYFQLLHQGPQPVPVDFIAVIDDDSGLPGHNDALLANCFAQSQALAFGKTQDEVSAEGAPDAAWLAPHRSFPGDRPSNTLLLEALTPLPSARCSRCTSTRCSCRRPCGASTRSISGAWNWARCWRRMCSVRSMAISGQARMARRRGW
jgi:glucose-6-phosphate isomerase